MVRLRESGKVSLRRSADIGLRNTDSYHSSLPVDDTACDLHALGNIEMSLSGGIVNIEFDLMDFGRESADVSLSLSLAAVPPDKRDVDEDNFSAVDNPHLSQYVTSSPELLAHYKVNIFITTFKR